LIALMKDQVDALLALGVPATFINSSLDPGEAGRRQTAVARGEVKLLYVAPERLMLPGFLRLLMTLPVRCFAIDEAHCISEWGHDFRPEYRELKQLPGLFPHATLAAFTATATKRVAADIKSQLGLRAPASFRGSFNRANLIYDVRPKQGAYRQLRTYLRRRGKDSGIIYCQSRAGTEALAERLCSDGFSATAYHAGLPSDERRERQEAFIKDNVQIIVATIAFGMGIDKPDVRFVVHYDLPKNIEGYYQESGRAGRDGDRSDCILFYSYGDVAKQEYFIDQKETLRERQIATQQLRQMANWASDTSCRRRALLIYFDEPFEGQAGPCCDVCSLPTELTDCSDPARLLLACAQQTGERFGVMHLIQVLRGSREERVLALRHDRLSLHGAGRDRSRVAWRHLAQELVSREYLREGEFNVVHLTERAKTALRDKEPILLAAPPQPAEEHAHAERQPQPHEALFEQLRALRKRLADEQGVPPYVIFHDSTLRLLAAALPASRQELLRVPGIGQRKADDYGDLVLRCVADFVQRTGSRPEPLPPPPAPPAKPAELTDTIRTSLDLFQNGQSVEQIAASRGMSLQTIESHIATGIERGEPIDLARLVSDAKRRAIEAAITTVGAAYLKPIMEQLGEGYTYAELRYVRGALLRRQRSTG
ncbi:MAG TPA: RecQ family ATP-dependent DNA helicase, partial [Steroidobacteraceae bacterium]|nr:RecQ family ATP-dependent DNA helicase [Steroidobacteraceae bacterium]